MPARKRKIRFPTILTITAGASLLVLILIAVLTNLPLQTFTKWSGLSHQVKAGTCRMSGDIMLITDNSNSMHGAKLKAALDAAKSFVDIVASYGNGDRIGFLIFADDAIMKTPLSSDYAAVKNAIDSVG